MQGDHVDLVDPSFVSSHLSSIDSAAGAADRHTSHANRTPCTLYHTEIVMIRSMTESALPPKYGDIATGDSSTSHLLSPPPQYLRLN